MCWLVADRFGEPDADSSWVSSVIDSGVGVVGDVTVSSVFSSRSSLVSTICLLGLLSSWLSLLFEVESNVDSSSDPIFISFLELSLQA